MEAKISAAQENHSSATARSDMIYERKLAAKLNVRHKEKKQSQL